MFSTSMGDECAALARRAQASFEGAAISTAPLFLGSDAFTYGGRIWCRRHVHRDVSYPLALSGVCI